MGVQTSSLHSLTFPGLVIVLDSIVPEGETLVHERKAEKSEGKKYPRQQQAQDKAICLITLSVIELKYSEYLKKHPRNKTMCSESYGLTLSGTVSQLDILHDFKELNMKILFLTSQHYIFEKMEHILEVKSILCFLEHLLFIG